VKPRIAWVPFGVCLVAFTCLDAEANQSESMALEGSRWTLVNVDSEFGDTEKDIIFGENGTLEVFDPNQQVVVTPGNDDWELQGKKITLRINDGYAVYEGEIHDQRTMGGEATNKAGLGWEWRAHRDLGRAVAEALPEQTADAQDPSSVLSQQPQFQVLEESSYTRQPDQPEEQSDMNAQDRSSVLPEQPQVQAVEESSYTQQPDQPEELSDMQRAETARIELSAEVPMSEDDVQAAIDSGRAKNKFEHIGLELWDITGFTDHSIWIYTPRAWIELQSFLAAENHRDVSLTGADIQPVLRVRVNPWTVPREAGSSKSPCRLLRTVVLEDEFRKSVLRPESEEKLTIGMRSSPDWGTYSCVGILATFSMSRVTALRALSPDAEFLVTVGVDADGTPTERVWLVKVNHFKELP
jgi:hypothetical protein